MIEYLLAVFVALAAYLAYKLFIKPLRIKAHYSKLFKAKGFKFNEFPYHVLKAPIF